MTSAFLSFQNIPPPPGQAQPAPAAAPAPPREGAPEAPQGGNGVGIGGLLPFLFIVPFLLFIFWSSRSQQKKQQAAIAALKKGDRIVTQSGLVGKLVEMGERYVKLEIAPGVKVEVVKTGVLGKDSTETAAAVEKKK